MLIGVLGNLYGKRKNFGCLFNCSFFWHTSDAGRISNLSADAQKEKEAILLYRRALEINPGSKEACLGLGNAYLTIGRNKEAIIWLKKALELDPDLAVAHHNLALAYYYAQKYDLAIKHSDRAGGLGYTISPRLRELLKPHRK